METSDLSNAILFLLHKGRENRYPQGMVDKTPFKIKNEWELFDPTTIKLAEKVIKDNNLCLYRGKVCYYDNLKIYE